MAKASINWEHLARTHVHLLRIQILETLLERDEAMSPKQLHQLLGHSLGVTSYHVKELAGKGLLTLERTEPRRGAVEHFYRVVVA